MNVDELKEELSNIEVSDYKWKEKMEMVTNFLRSQGIQVKDLKKNILTQSIPSFFSDVITKVYNPTIYDLKRLKQVESVSQHPDMLISRIDGDYIKALCHAKGNLKEEVVGSDDVFWKAICRETALKATLAFLRDEKYKVKISKKMVDIKNNLPTLNQSYEELQNHEVWDVIGTIYEEDENLKSRFNELFVKELKGFANSYENNVKEALITRITAFTTFLAETRSSR